jgi:hypothetical protein
MTQSLNQKRLIQMGQAIWGINWKRPMVRAMGVTNMQVHRWFKGEYEPSDERIEQLREIGRKRAKEIMEVCK